MLYIYTKKYSHDYASSLISKASYLLKFPRRSHLISKSEEEGCVNRQCKKFRRNYFRILVYTSAVDNQVLQFSSSQPGTRRAYTPPPPSTPSRTYTPFQNFKSKSKSTSTSRRTLLMIQLRLTCNCEHEEEP